MKMLPHCHPVEAHLLAFITTDQAANVLGKLQKKITTRKILTST